MSLENNPFDCLHDSQILSYCVDFKAHTLHMTLQSEDGEKKLIQFVGLMAHWFKNVIQNNILFGMNELSINKFLEQYKGLLEQTIPYGFPALCSAEKLKERMIEEGLRIFVIDSSLGLCGFVLAKEIQMINNEKRSIGGNDYAHIRMDEKI